MRHEELALTAHEVTQENAELYSQIDSLREALAEAERERDAAVEMAESLEIHVQSNYRLAAERDEAVKRAEAAEGDAADNRTAWLNSNLESERQMAYYQMAAPLCDEHQPDGGARSGCLVCALMEQSSALSRIDYACGEPNDMECSDYDLHCDPSLVVKRVQSVTTQLATLRGALEAIANHECGTEDEITLCPYCVQMQQIATAALASLSPAPEAETGGQSDG